MSPFAFLRLRRTNTWSFHVVVLQRTAKGCTKIYNAFALVLLLNLLFDDVLVAVVVMASLSSLFTLDDEG